MNNEHIFKLLASILIFSNCSLFEKNEKILAEIKNRSNNKIQIVYVSLGATTNDVIQVKMVEQRKTLKVFEKYNYLQEYKLINDSTLYIVLNDTGYFDNKLDTFLVNIK